MASPTGTQARLNVRLSPELKELIEQAALHTGQTLSEYAVSTLVQNARTVLRQHEFTILSQRDRDVFLALLDGKVKPNAALRKAAKRYKNAVG